MNQQDRERIPEDLGRIAELLHKSRPEAGALELDRIKLRAKASRRSQVLVSGRGYGLMRTRLIGLILAVGLVGGGTAALAAAGGGPFAGSSKTKASANSQYCPPTSQQPNKPKKPGPAKCGKAGEKSKKSKRCVSSKGKKHKKQASTSKKRRCVSAKGKKHKKSHKRGKHHKKHKKHKSSKKHGKK
jgi:hypothetical protein